jgi:uncharacterized membrane protein
MRLFQNAMVPGQHRSGLIKAFWGLVAFAIVGLLTILGSF